MGILESQKKILAFTFDYHFIDIRSIDCPDKWLSYSTIYLYIILKINSEWLKQF